MITHSILHRTIKLLAQGDARSAYPMTWQEQDRLFQHLPGHLKNMALFAVNTGCREQEICSLKWKWEHEVEELNTSVFVIPAALVKNGDNRLVVLNRIAQSVVEACRGNHSEQVFTYKGNPVKAMNTTAWKNARRRAQLDVRVHDLKHTFGRRLRAAGVSFEDRQDLLGHKSSRVTTNYSVAEVEELLVAANRVCDRKRSTPILRVIRGNK